MSYQCPAETIFLRIILNPWVIIVHKELQVYEEDRDFAESPMYSFRWASRDRLWD
jgi:hypothetical protein